jgi:CSLREA domain-containing protein
MRNRRPEIARGGPTRLPFAALALLGAFVACPPGARAINFTVTRTDDQVDTSPGDGQCVAQNGGGCSLRAAVQEANALSGAHGIDLPAGTCVLTRLGAGEDFAATGDLDVTSAITLVGDGWAASTIEMQMAADRLFDIQGFSSLELADVTLAGGAIAGIGGGVFVRAGGGLTLRRSRVHHCTAHHGGAIGTLGGTVLVEDSELAANRASEAPPTWYARGPAIASDSQGVITVRRSSLHDNRVLASGSLGGIAIWDSSLTIESSSIVDDGAPGGSYSVNADNSDVVVVSSTLARLTVAGITLPGATLSLGCSIVAYCTLVGGNVSYSSNGLNIFFDGITCLGPNDTNGEWEMFPLWAAPGKFPARFPNSYSSAIDGGHNFVCAAVDQWGQIRPRDNDGDGIAVPEVGAVEASVPFLDGFEIGSTAIWSHTYD